MACSGVLCSWLCCVRLRLNVKGTLLGCDCVQLDLSCMHTRAMPTHITHTTRTLTSPSPRRCVRPTPPDARVRQCGSQRTVPQVGCLCAQCYQPMGVCACMHVCMCTAAEHVSHVLAECIALLNYSPHKRACTHGRTLVRARTHTRTHAHAHTYTPL